MPESEPTLEEILRDVSKKIRASLESAFEMLGATSEKAQKDFTLHPPATADRTDEETPAHTSVTPAFAKPSESILDGVILGSVLTGPKNFSVGWTVGVRYKVFYLDDTGGGIYGIRIFDGHCINIGDDFVSLQLEKNRNFYRLHYAKVVARQQFVRMEPVWEEA